ncbi:MAG: tetratricopeptide repeat protein, partial [Blastocatellia bacterium]
WISALPDVLAGVFALASLMLYESLDHGGGRRRSLLVLSMGFALLAMLSKEVAVVIPLFLALREWLDRTEQETYTSTLSRLLRRTAPFVMISVLYFALRYWVLGFISKAVPNAAGVTASQVFLTIPSILLRYARLFFFPSSLAIVYDDQYVSYATDIRFWGSVLIVGALVGALLLVRTSQPGRRAVVWSILSLLPVLNLKAFNHEESLAHDRYLYVPSIGLSVLAAIALTFGSSRFEKLQRQVFFTGTVLIAVILFGLTVYQNRSWRNFIALANHASTVAPKKSFLYYNLACAYETQGQDLEAEHEYHKAIQYKPSHIEAHINLAVLLTKQARYAEALDYLNVPQSLAPDHPVMLYALGNLYMRTNRYKEAIEAFDQLTRIKPQHRMVYTNLGLCYETLKDTQKARAAFQKAIEVAPAEEWTNVARKHLATLEK